jgi:hypothetical protein
MCFSLLCQKGQSVALPLAAAEWTNPLPPKSREIQRVVMARNDGSERNSGEQRKTFQKNGSCHCD